MLAVECLEPEGGITEALIELGWKSRDVRALAAALPRVD
jgi:hypothetical protein